MKDSKTLKLLQEGLNKKGAIMMIVETKRIGYDNRYALIIPDHATGKPKRFTVYLIPTSPGSRKIRIVGRELPLGLSKKIAQHHLKKFKSI